MSAGKEIDKKRGPITIDFSLPMQPAEVRQVEPAKETEPIKPTPSDAETCWYPAFQLASNPFSTFDAGTEHRAKVFSFVAEDFTPMIKRVKALVSAKSSAIIEGERGCGKTSIVGYFEINDKNLTTLVSPRNVTIIEHAMRRHIASKIGQEGPLIVRDVIVGIASKERMEIFRKVAAEVARLGLLFDMPDNFSHKAAFGLADLCARVLDEGGFVILFATLEQARMLKRLDTFARFPAIKFERPDDDFFVELFSSRVKQAQPAEASLPIEKDAITKIAKIADHNPRRFILLCSRLLTEMRERKMDRPLDEKAADELLKDANMLAEAPIDVTEALQTIMREAGSSGAKWVKVKDVRNVLIERYSIDLKPETIGRKLTEIGYARRYAPDAEYLAVK